MFRGVYQNGGRDFEDVYLNVSAFLRITLTCKTYISHPRATVILTIVAGGSPIRGGAARLSQGSPLASVQRGLRYRVVSDYRLIDSTAH